MRAVTRKRTLFIAFLASAALRPARTAPAQTLPASQALYGVPNGLRYDAGNIVLAPDGSIWFASGTENVVARLSADRTKVTRWTMPKDAAPNAIALDSQGQIWLTELGNFRMARLDPASNVLTEWQDAASR